MIYLTVMVWRCIQMGECIEYHSLDGHGRSEINGRRNQRAIHFQSIKAISPVYIAFHYGRITMQTLYAEFRKPHPTPLLITINGTVGGVESMGIRSPEAIKNK